MLLRSIKYHNFRPFIGEQAINFVAPVDRSDANVTVILGENTFGKSTIVLSFIWCFYGESRFNRDKDILNKKVEAEMEISEVKEAWVEIEFEDGGKRYIIKRTQKFSMEKKRVLKANPSTVTFQYITETGEPKPVGRSAEGIRQAMNEILPHDLASFFFFEGEKNNEIEKKDLGDAVRTLLGLKAYGNMRVHLMGSDTATAPTPASVMGYYLEQQTKLSGDKAQKAYDEMIKTQAELEEIEREISEVSEQIDFYEAQRNKIDEQLRAAAPYEELIRSQNLIKKGIKQCQRELEEYRKKLVKLFEQKSFPLFLVPLIPIANQRLQEMDVADKGISGLEAPAILELLSRGVCLCGTDLKPGTLAYKNVQKYIDYIPPKSVGTIVANMIEQLGGTKTAAEEFVENFEDYYRSMQRCKVRLAELEQEDEEKTAELARIGEFDVNEIKARLSECKQRVRDLRQRHERAISNKGSKKNQLETATHNFNRLKSNSEQARKYMEYYMYAEAVYNWVNAHYSQKEKEMRERLNRNVTELFNTMYAGQREIKIDEKYNINLTVEGTVVDITGGLRVIQYFAYVGGLVKLAYEVMQEREKDADGNESIMGEQYPLVLDAAFSHADEKHTKNIANALASSCTQLIFAVMRKDWLHAQDGLIGRVGRMYELQKISETEAKIVEV